MIYDQMKNLSRYRGVHPNLDIAVDAILGGILAGRKKGRNTIEGESVYFSYPGDMRTKPVTEAKIEGHRFYADIHILFAGEETLGYTSADLVREISYTEKYDFVEYEGKCDIFVPLRPEMFVLFFPGEPHQPLIQTDMPRLLDKAVMKIDMRSGI